MATYPPWYPCLYDNETWGVGKASRGGNCHGLLVPPNHWLLVAWQQFFSTSSLAMAGVEVWQRDFKS